MNDLDTTQPAAPVQEPIDTNPPVAAPEPIDTNPTVSGVPLSSQLAAIRAYKALMGVGPIMKKTYQDLYAPILGGDEKGVRDEAASAVDATNAQNKAQAIRDLAVKNGAPLNQNEINSILDPAVPTNQPANPNTVIEEGYGHYYVSALERAAVSMQDTFLDAAVKEIPDQNASNKAQASTLAAKREIIQTKLENLEDARKNEGWGSYLGNYALNMIPGQLYQNYRLRDGMQGGGLGNNLEAQGVALFQKPMPDFQKTFNSTVDAIAAHDPNLAIMYAQAMLGQSTEDKFINNMMPLIDTPIAVDVGLGTAVLARKISLANAVRAARKDILKTGADPNITASKLSAAAGDTGHAAVEAATDDLNGKLAATNDPIKDAVNTLPQNFRLDKEKIVNDPGDLPLALTNVLKDNYETAESNVITAVVDTAKALRLPMENVTPAKMDELRQALMDEHPHVNVANISDPVHDPVSGGWYYDMKVTDHNGELFKNPEQAALYAEIKGIVNPKIETQGLGNWIRVTERLPEDHYVLRDLFGATKDARSAAVAEEGMGRWLNAIIGRFRSPEDTLALQENQRRKAATYAQARLQLYAEAEGRYISDVAKGIVRIDPVTGEKLNPTASWAKSFFGIGPRIKAWKQYQQFKRVVDQARFEIDPETGLPGHYFQTPRELNDYYQRAFQRAPSFPEVQGYFAKVRLDEYDRVLRNISEFRNRARLGAASHTIYAYDKNGEKISSQAFDGISMDHWPGGHEDNIAIIDRRFGREKVHSLGTNDIPSETLKKYQEKIKTGRARIIRIYDPESRPLSEFSDRIGDARVRYIYSDAVDTTPLSWDQVARRGGGHFEYDYNFYIKQPKMRFEQIGKKITNWYEGDTTLMPISNRAMGHDLVRRLEEARLLYRAKDFDGAKAYVEKNLPMDWKTFDGWFKKGRDPSGNVLPARLDPRHPFYVVPKNSSVLNLGKDLENRYLTPEGHSTFRDGTIGHSDARLFQTQYTGERDAYDMFTVANKGSRFNPIYNMEQPELLDPLTTMNRGLSRIINSTFMDDYKMYAVTNWLKEASQYMNAKETEIRGAPFYHFNKVENDFKRDAPRDIVANLRANREKIKQFVGVPSKFDTYLHDITQQLVDAAYNKFGPEDSRGLAAKAVTVVPLWALSHVKDPITFVRSLAFNAKLGLFALPQLMVQSQTYATIWALSPRHAPQGTLGAMLHQWSRFSRNPEILAHLDGIATKMGYKPGEFLEAMKQLDFTGFAHVAGEYAGLDDAMKHTFVKNDFNNFLSLGQMFFKGGERNVRFGAWYTAFREFRSANPTLAITDVERNSILQRADLLYTNMSRASSSMIHQGVFSLTTQFLSYQIRLAELFFSKRIGETVADRALARARMFGVYSALYGVPSALGLSGLPLGDYFRKEGTSLPGLEDWHTDFAQMGLDNGYVVGKNFTKSLINEGIPAMALAWATGKGDIQKGNFYNVGPRYGVQGFTQLSEALRSDHPWWNIVGGAGINTVANTAASFDGLTMAMKSMLTGKKGEEYFPLKIDDFTALFREISSFSTGEKFIAALNTGKWLNKNGAYVTDTSKLNAMFMSVSGLSPQEQSDQYLKSEIKADEVSLQKKNFKLAIADYQAGAAERAKDIPNIGQSDAYFQRAFARLVQSGYPREKWPQFLAIAGRGYESILDQASNNFSMRDVPEDKKPIRIQQQLDQLRINAKQKEPN